MNRLFLCLLAFAMLAACAHPRQPVPQKTPAPAPAATTPATTPAAAAPATISPYGFVYTPSPESQDPDPASPRILEIDLNDRVLAAPGPVRVRVLTNAVVNSVIVGTMGRQLAVPQQAIGVFGVDDELPNIPFFLRNRTYGVQFIATAPGGRTTSVTIPIMMR